MSDKSNHRLKFYEIIKTFKEQIIELLMDPSLGFDDKQKRENIRKLENMYDKLILAKSANSRLPIEFFYRSVVIPYGQYVITQNEQFFLQNKEIVDDVQMQFDVLVDELGLIWTKLDANNKKIMWRYLLALCKIADTVIGDNYMEHLKNTFSKKI